MNESETLFDVLDVIIIVRGGVVQDVFADSLEPGIKVRILDYDNLEHSSLEPDENDYLEFLKMENDLANYYQIF